MDNYNLIGKIVNNRGILIGYILKNTRGENISIARQETILKIAQISNAKLRGNYIVLKSGKTMQLPIIKYSKLKSETNNEKRKEQFRDFSNYKLDTTVLDGVNNKVVVIDTISNDKYILKFGRYNLESGERTKDYISEYISCKIAKQLGYSVQEVELGYFNGKECVAIKHFGTIPTTFRGLGYSTLNDEILHSRDVRYSLDWLLKIVITDKFGISQKEYEQWVWKVFILDMFIGNYDRHEGNWGFLTKNNKKVPSPLYDMGASLFIKEMQSVKDWDNGKIKNEIETRMRSSILIDGKKRGYFRILEIYTKNNVVKDILKWFIAKVESNIASFDGIYNTVKQFNPEYADYANFVRKMLNIKLKMLRRFI